MVRLSRRLVALLAVLSFSATAERAAAQPKSEKDAKGGVPKEYLPPAGMCRVWVDGVPANQQPAPTDCAAAVRNKPANGRVIYGEDKAKGNSKVDDLPVNRLKQVDRKGPPLVPPDLSSIDPRIRDQFESKKITDEQLFGDQPARTSPASSYPGTSPSPQGPMGSYGGYVTPGGAVVPGVVNDPRYFSGARPPGTGSSVCLDRDGDGWCDDLRYGPPTCRDIDGDGRCDDLPEFASRAYPQVLPPMRAALDVVQGRPSVDVMQWIGTNEFVVRIPDQGRGGIPWRAIFLDADNSLLQVWTDVNRDGRADRIEIFRDGKRVKLIQR
jgi:hypothetical protein